MSPAVGSFVVEATSSPLYLLPQKLDSFPQHWPLPRGDLYHWIPLLDRFDHVLELFNKEYGLADGPQTQPIEQKLIAKGDFEEEMPYPQYTLSGEELDTAGYSEDGDRELVESILHFTRILLERCGNRSLYASTRHINNLLHTTSLDLLRSALKLALRLALRYQVARYKNQGAQNQASVKLNHYNFEIDNLQKIAQAFPKQIVAGQGTSGKGKDKASQTLPFNPSDLVSLVKDPQAATKHDLASVTCTFYGSPRANEEARTEAAPQTPTPARRASVLGPSRERPAPVDRSVSANDVASETPFKSTEANNAPKVYQVSSAQVAQTPAWELVKDAVKALPSEYHYDVLNRIRIAKALTPEALNVQRLLEIRLLAISNLAYALPEKEFTEKVGQADAEEPRRFHLSTQLCDLLQPSSTGQAPLSLDLETVVVQTIEALTKCKPKLSEVADALSLNANHGVLYYELRKVIGTLRHESLDDLKAELRETEWREAMFELVNSLAITHPQHRFADKMLNAGIIAILVDVLNLRTSRAERFYERILGSFDSFVHNLRDAFQTLANAKGLDAIANLTDYEVQKALQEQKGGKVLPANFRSKVVDYSIPYFQQATLRQLFKVIAHLFEAGAGMHDFLLRNLIDTPQILGSLRAVITNAHVFGSNVFNGAIGIVSTFIHNEPTSYQVIAEAGLSKGLLETVAQRQLPEELPDDTDVVNLTNAQPEVPIVDGKMQFPEVKGVLPVGETMQEIPNAFGAICLSESGMKLFQSSGALTEFLNVFVSPTHVRALEEESQTTYNVGQQFDELSRHHPQLKEQILSAVVVMIKRVISVCQYEATYHAVGAKLYVLDGDKIVVDGGSASLTNSADTNSKPVEAEDDDIHRASATPYVATCMKFLEGFLNNNSMCALFCEQAGAELIMDLATSPSTPYDFQDFSTTTRIGHVMKTMAEQKAHLVLPSIISRVQLSLKELKPFIDGRPAGVQEQSFVFSYSQLKGTGDEALNGTKLLRALLVTQLATSVLSRTFTHSGYNGPRHGTASPFFLGVNFTDVYIELVDGLSRLHSACLWENLVLKDNIDSESLERTNPRPHTHRKVGSDGKVELCNDGSAKSRTDDPEEEDRSVRFASSNIRSLRYALFQTPLSIEHFFGNLSQALAPRKLTEMGSKQNANIVAEHLAQATLWQLSHKRFASDYSRVRPETEILYESQVLDAKFTSMQRHVHSMDNTGQEALTLVLSKVYLDGGLTKFNSLLEKYLTIAKSKAPGHEHAYEALTLILDFYNIICRSRSINDASQSANISGREPTQAYYFHPGQFLVEIRNEILPTVDKLLHVDGVETLQKNVNTLIDILRVILKAEGEDRAFKRHQQAKRAIPAEKVQFKLKSHDQVPKLVGDGFSEDLAKEALFRCNYDENRAHEYCSLRSRLDQVQRFPLPGSDPSPSNPKEASSEDAMDTSDVTAQASSQARNAEISSPDHDMMSEDDNFGSLGALPQDVLEGDLDEMIPAGIIRNVFLETHRTEASTAPPAVETEQPFVTVEDLDEKRSKVKKDLVERCLEILSVLPIISFDLADLIQAAVSKSGEGASPRAEIAQTLVSSLMSLQGEEPEDTEESKNQYGQKISGYAHLVGLILQDRDFFDSTLDELKEYFDVLVKWIHLQPDQKSEDAPWIDMILLIIERVLAEDEQPVQMHWTPPPAEDPLQPLPEPVIPEQVVSDEVRSTLFHALVELLPKVGKNSRLALSITRVLVILTRRRQLAIKLSEKQTMSRLFMMVRQLAGSVSEKIHTSFMLILRHMVEDEDLIRETMRTEISVTFEGHRHGRGLDIPAYVRTLYHLVLRDPKLFAEVTNEMLEITRFDNNPHRPAQGLALKKTPEAINDPNVGTNDNGAKESPAPDSATKGAESKLPTAESTTAVIQFLLRELSNFREVDDRSSPAKVPQPAGTPTDVEMPDASTNGVHGSHAAGDSAIKPTEKPEFRAEEHPIFVYRCFLLQCLAELLRSYNCTKSEFIKFSRKAETQYTPTKPRSGTLNYLLNVLLPVGTLENKDEVPHRKKLATSHWSKAVLVALCSRTAERHIPRSYGQSAEEDSDLSYVRKFVLEHALRSFKDAMSSTDTLDQRYSRLLALSALFSDMLTGGSDQGQRASGISAEPFAESQQHLGRLMYDRNFIGTLTSAIAEIDLNYPNAKRAVKYILSPLKWLTDLAVTLSQAGDISSSNATSTEEDEISSATSVSEDEEEREQTPDLFHHSSLARLEPGGEEEEDSESDDEDDGDEMDYGFDDGYDDGMQYEEEPMAEHGDVVSDEEDDVEGMGDIEGMPGDVDMNVEVLMEEDDEDTEDGEDDDEDDDDEDEEDDDEHDFAEHMDEITGDDENASLADDHDPEGEWEDDAGDFDADEDDLGSPHGGPLEHIARVIGAGSDHDEDDVIHVNMGNDGDEEFFEDEMAPEDDEEDDEAGEGDYDNMFEPELEDDDDDVVHWDALAPPPPTLSLNHPHTRTGIYDMLHLSDNLRAPIFRSHRTASAPRQDDDPGINPLLQRHGNTGNVRPPTLTQGRAIRSGPLAGRGGDFLHELIQRIGPGGTGTMRIEGNPSLWPGLTGMPPPIISIGARNAVIEMDINGGGGSALNDIRLATSPRWADMYGNPAQEQRPLPNTEEARAVHFRPMLTTQRWQEEARLLYSNNKHHDKATRIIPALQRLLVPQAMEVKRQQDKAAADKEREEKLREEEKKRAEAERLEREERERKEREEREAREKEEAAARAREQEAQQNEAANAPDTANFTDAGTSMEGVEQTEAAVQSTPQAEEQRQRITITMRGRELDITDLGIDREYLEALPEDMREEVIAAQVAEQRSQQVQAGEQPSEISREFLEALPADIQRELLRQEAHERRRREREEARRQAQQSGTQHPAQPEDMNNADFMATLEPDLRRTILMDADEAMIAALPENLQREAQQLYGNRPHRWFPERGAQIANDDQHRHINEPVSRQRRPVVQMLDKSGIATLLRLMFVSLHQKAKSSLHGVLSDICKNTQNRAEVISILLSILQDGTADVGAVERNFAQLSLRAKQFAGQKNPQPSKRSVTNQMFAAPGSDLSPLNIVHQCLITLKALAEDNSRVPSFFLSEHETAAPSQKLKTAKKGRNTKAAKFPLNALLTLLDRKLIIENTGVMETLASLLSRVTHPLQILLKRSREEAESQRERERADLEQRAVEESTSDGATTNEQATGAADSTIEARNGQDEQTAVADAQVAAAPSDEKTAQSSENKDKRRELTPPEVPEENMRLVVNILAARECSSHTFRDALDIVKNLSLIPGAKEIFGKELIRQAQELGQAIAEDLLNLAKHVDSAESGTDLQGMALASFSTSSAKQRKLLRVLIALDHLFDPKFVPSTPGSDAPELKSNILSILYESTIFDKLWQNLSLCLTAIRMRGNMVNVATILLPVIESLHVVCRNVSLRDPQDSAPSTPEGRLEELFFRFTEEHRKILNELVRNNPKLIHGNLSVLAKNSKVLEFDNKRTFFGRKLHSRSNQDRGPHHTLQLNVRREYVFLDSFKSLYYKSGSEIKYGKLNIRFHNEEGIDAGGVSREWFGAMARQMFNPDYALFNPVASDRTTFHPNPLSDINSEHLLFFKFIGRIIGKALYEGRLLDAHFSRAVYKKILGRPVSLKDMETVDLDFYRSLEWILNNNITDITFEKFSVEVDRFGEMITVDLIPNGRNVDVTEENKQEYVRLIVEHRLLKSVEVQLQEFLTGFHEIIPAELVSIFTEQELELLISGLPDIDVDDWKNNSEYHNYQATSPQIQWFWRAVRSFDQEEQAKLLQFVTGTSKVPLNGFQELEGMNGFAKFNIHRDYSSNKEKLPTSHTCFNQLDLPEYESYERLRQQLYTAITAGSEYFGFA